MGTRSLTHIYLAEKDETPFITIYRQYDGYPSGIGEDIKKILAPRELTNGFQDKHRQCNGMQCAAALLVAGLKGTDCGNVYLYPAGSVDCGEDYIYRIYPAEKTFRLVIDGEYDGLIGDFDSAKVESTE